MNLFIVLVLLVALGWYGYTKLKPKDVVDPTPAPTPEPVPTPAPTPDPEPVVSMTPVDVTPPLSVTPTTPPKVRKTAVRTPKAKP